MPEFSHRQLMRKLKRITGFQQLLEQALLLYVLLTDGDVPGWVKAAAIAALVYLIDPLDAIPDITPLVGYADDLAVIAAAIKALSAQIMPHHQAQADDIFNSL